MSFHNSSASCFLTFYRSDQSLLLFKFKIFVLNTSLFTFYTTLCSWYNFAWLQYGRTIISMVEVGLTAGWMADEMQVDFENFKILYRLNYSDFYFIQYCYNVIICTFQQVFLN